MWFMVFMGENPVATNTSYHRKLTRSQEKTSNSNPFFEVPVMIFRRVLKSEQSPSLMSLSWSSADHQLHSFLGARRRSPRKRSSPVHSVGFARHPVGDVCAGPLAETGPLETDFEWLVMATQPYLSPSIACFADLSSSIS